MGLTNQALPPIEPIPNFVVPPPAADAPISGSPPGVERAQRLRATAHTEASKWQQVPGWAARHVERQIRHVASETRHLLARLVREQSADHHPGRRLLIENARLIRTASDDVRTTCTEVRRLPCVKDSGHLILRCYAAARTFLDAAEYEFREGWFILFCEALQSILKMDELWALKPMLQLVLLERILGSSSEATRSLSVILGSLRQIGEADWNTVFDGISAVEQTLRKDPAGAYALMDFESRDMYRNVVAELARHSGKAEIEVAGAAVELAAESRARIQNASRLRERCSHVGFYLIGDGLFWLRRRIDYRSPWSRSIQDMLRRNPNLFYLVGIEVATLAIIAVLLSGVSRFAPIFAAVCLLLIPASQAAVEFLNNLTSFVLRPRRLPKLDLSAGIPDDFATMVAVPALLLNEEQVRDLVDQLEIRFLADRGPNLYFALLTDPPDSSQPVDDKDQLVSTCEALIENLNRRYAPEGSGPFFLFHRHRVYNPAQEAWMGWERKRGKLLDLNKLLRREYDSFPVKAGNLEVLPRIKFVITLDSDTRLPKDSARKLVGTLAHPLNRAIIDPRTNVVTAGYGILQPRIGVSVHSASRSRLAGIFSGETGFDIYTRAVSDVYQDLFGEGIFTGKGIYDVDAFQAVLDLRFPCNTLLSHDLIEGAYGRAALVSDIELIDDYPSHFSAYSRRKHRWLRGDWQIMRWLLRKVPDYTGRLVQNPTSFISRWKIVDNLRRSLFDPATLILMLAGWFVLPETPAYWTVVGILLLLSPIYSDFVFGLIRWMRRPRIAELRDILNAFMKGHFRVLFALCFLPHQAFLAIDAIVRSMVRTALTHRRLLEWETAAESEMGSKKTPVDRYSELVPWMAVLIAVLAFWLRPAALPAAGPILTLWFFSGAIARWLDRPPAENRSKLNKEDEQFLRCAALCTWRYFREFSTEANHWLIPDNVQESNGAVANRVSPTNLALLLNTRQAAREFGYLTLQEFVQQTRLTLDSISRLESHNGHFYNWYDTQSLEPLKPRFVSTVDSGNLLGALWTLKQGCLQMSEQEILGPQTWQGIRDHVRLLRRIVDRAVRGIEERIGALGDDTRSWVAALPDLRLETQRLQAALAGPRSEAGWWVAELANRIDALQFSVDSLLPWLRPEYRDIASGAPERLALQDVASASHALEVELPDTDLARTLRLRLKHCRDVAAELQQDLQRTAACAHTLAERMNFRFLFNRKRKLLSVGFDAEQRRISASYYDLLASEARMAVFAAIAKNDIPQEAWFHLGRTHEVSMRRAILLSWTGTMFEYLMPFLWMKAYPNTLLDRSMKAVVSIQQRYASRRAVPWGISESACCRTDATGNYQYQAFGIRSLALKPALSDPLVISPYSTFLALAVDTPACLANLRAMDQRGWQGTYGFYEAADFSANPRSGDCQTVRCWMAHHQGMSLLAACNLIFDSPFPRLFHAEPQVQSTELLLQERVPRMEAVTPESLEQPAIGAAEPALSPSA